MTGPNKIFELPVKSKSNSSVAPVTNIAVPEDEKSLPPILLPKPSWSMYNFSVSPV